LRSEVYQLARPLLVEEKIVISYSILFPQFAKMRQLARDVSWQAWKLERAGQHARAITLRADFARLCNMIPQGRSSIISGLVEQACRAIIWSGNPNRRVRGRGPNRNFQTAQKFAAYARSHGFDDVAEETLRIGREAQQRQAKITRSINTQTHLTGVPMARFNQIQGLWWLSLFCLLQIPFLLVFTAMQGVALLGSRPEPRGGSELASMVVTFFATALVLYGVWRFFCFEPTRAYDLLLAVPEDLASLLLSSGLPLLLVWPVSWAWLWCGFRIAGRRWNERKVLSSRHEITPPLEIGQRAPVNPGPIIINWIAWGFLFVMASCLIGALVLWRSTSSVTLFNGTVIDLADCAPVLLGLGAFLMNVCYAGWFVKWRWLSPAEWQPIGHRLLHDHRRLLGNFLLIISLFYVASLWFAMPLRAEAERDWAQFLQRGEMAYLK
jgi:hypothetical protein